MSTFRYSLNTSTIKPATLREKIRVASEAGYTGIELWNDELTAFTTDGGSLRDVRSMLEDAGLSVPTVLHIREWLDADDGEPYRQALDEARRRMDQAAEVGAERIIAGPPIGRCDYARASRRYEELLAIGREYGVLPALEFLGFVEDVNNIGSLMRIASGVHDPDKSVVLDSFHIFRGGSSPDDLDQVPTEMIAVVHLNDAPGTIPREEQKDSDRVLPGDGALPLKEIFTRLMARDYEGWFSLELFNASLWEKDPLSVAKEGLIRIRSIVEQAHPEVSTQS